MLKQITVLDDLNTNPCYENLRELVADYNNISSINKLEGSKFLDNYQILSLRHNKIKSVSVFDYNIVDGGVCVCLLTL